MRYRIFIIIFIILVVIVVTLSFTLMKKEKKQKEEIIRAPAVAGAFYPAQEKVLAIQVDGFLEKVELGDLKGVPQILILPHAGYMYSGGVAAYGAKSIQGEDFTKVVLIGPSHTDWFEGVSIYEKGSWSTPLGLVEVDEDFAQKLIKENEKIFFWEKAHSEEHCLEVELPFLQRTLKDFKIVPIIMGAPSKQNTEILARALTKYIDEKTLIVISSDLVHYPRYEIANEVDRKTIEAILTGDVELFEKAIEESMSKGYENLGTCACGAEPIKVGLLLAKKLGLNEIKLLKYANSGDVTGDHSRVVGYAAIAFSQIKEQPEEGFSDQERQILLKIARESIEVYLKNKKIPDIEVASPGLTRPQGAFVTLRKNHQLRGCIGRIEEHETPLYKVVSEMAIAAATQDARFRPVELKEMEDVNIEISVLSPPKKIKDPTKEIELGKHGVIIKQGFRSGVFLPQVAVETGWDLEEFMGQLSSQKTGLARDSWKTGQVDIYVFTAEVFEEK